MLNDKNDPLQKLESLTQKLNDEVGARTQNVLGRYPILFSLLTIFGVVAVLYGFEEAIGQIPFLAERPLLVFLLGILILIGTGTLYKGLRQSIR